MCFSGEVVVETTKSAPPPPSKLNNSRRSRGEIPTVAVLPSVSAAAAGPPPTQQPKPESFPLAERNKTPASVGGRQHQPEPAIVSVTTAIKPVVKPAAAEQVVLINARELKL